MKWELVNESPFERVRRHKVPGGWLYQVEKYDWSDNPAVGNTTVFSPTLQTAQYVSGWHPPVFVPDSSVVCLCDTCAGIDEQNP